MSSYLIALVGLIYLWIGVDQGMKGNMAMCIVFCGYSFSNVGLYLGAVK